MNAKLFQFGRELLDDLRDPDVLWQFGTLALCVAAAWWLARLLRRSLGERIGKKISERLDAHEASGDERSLAIGQHLRLVGGGFSRILFPLLALALVLISRAVLAPFHHVNFLNLAVPLLTAFAAVRALVYLLRQVFAPSGALAAGERWIAIAVWCGVALHFTGWLPELSGALDAVGFHFGKLRISLWLMVQAVASVAFTLLLSLWLSTVIEGRLMRADSIDLSLRVVLGRFIKALLSFSHQLNALRVGY